MKTNSDAGDRGGESPPLIISAVGYSGSGKTTFLERVAKGLVLSGIRVGYVKSSDHRADPDEGGSDTGRLAAAGAATTILLGAGSVVVRSPGCGPGEMTGLDPAHRDSGGPGGAGESRRDEIALHLARCRLWNLRDALSDCDVVLIEGLKASPFRKILINKDGNPAGMLHRGDLCNVIREALLPAAAGPLFESEAGQCTELVRRLLRAPARVNAGDLVGVALAGGRSARMGWDKALIQLDGAARAPASGRHRGTWLERTYALLAQHTSPVWIIGRTSRSGGPALPNLTRPALSHLDLRNGAGPLGGLETALIANAGSGILAAHCDLPSLREDALEWIIASRARGARATCIRCADRPHPVVLILEADALPELSAYLDAGGRSVIDFLGPLKTNWLEAPESLVARFENINTHEDFQRYRRSANAGTDGLE